MQSTACALGFEADLATLGNTATTSRFWAARSLYALVASLLGAMDQNDSKLSERIDAFLPALETFYRRMGLLRVPAPASAKLAATCVRRLVSHEAATRW